jgi:hypothetical protein
MTDLRQAAQRALEALKSAAIFVDSFRGQKATQEAITALRKALEQPEQEPVACLSKTQAKAILDLALDLEKTGRLVSLTEGQERSNFVARNRAIQCALEDALRNATTPPAAQPEQVDCPRCGHVCSQRPWVGLTDEDVNRESAPITSQMKLAFHSGMYVAQQILKERNT